MQSDVRARISEAILVPYQYGYVGPQTNLYETTTRNEAPAGVDSYRHKTLPPGALWRQAPLYLLREHASHHGVINQFRILPTGLFGGRRPSGRGLTGPFESVPSRQQQR